MVDNFGRWYPDYPGQQPYQDPMYARAMGQQYNAQQAAPAQSQQALTPPTIRAEIIQVDSPEAIDRFPQNPGSTQMYMTKDEAFIIIRSVLANGEHTDVIYDKRPPAPPVPTIDPADYVRKEDLPALIAEVIQNMKGAAK
jgi:hypothetical protein